ncbi:EAL domain-containing protein [Aerococcaceae bacterium WGS1372]
MGQLCSSVIEDLYLVFQPIIQLVSKDRKEINEFEVLLRSKTTGTYPRNLMDQYTAIEELNKQLLNWYKEELETYCQKYPHYVFNINIHPQQFIHPSTWDFLKDLKEYAGQINIEITEKHFFLDNMKLVPQNHMGAFIKQLRLIGYKVSFDDVGSGLNSFEMVAKNIDKVDCLKFSLHSFRYVDKVTVSLFLKAWRHLAQSHEKKIVIEGVEDASMSEELYAQGFHWQQGYYWAKSCNL